MSIFCRVSLLVCGISLVNIMSIRYMPTSLARHTLTPDWGHHGQSQLASKSSSFQVEPCWIMIVAITKTQQSLSRFATFQKLVEMGAAFEQLCNGLNDGESQAMVDSTIFNSKCCRLEKRFGSSKNRWAWVLEDVVVCYAWLVGTL